MMGTISSQITSLTIVYSTVYSDADQRKHQSSASLAFVRGIHRGPVNSPHKWPVARKMFPFDDVIMDSESFDFCYAMGWVGLWGFLWWAPSAKRKDHHGVSSGWSSVWHRSNTGLSSTQYEQIPIILGVWPFWLTPFFFRSITFRRDYG